MPKRVLDHRKTGFGMIKPGAGEAREIARTGTKAEKDYLKDRIKAGKSDSAVVAVNKVRGRRKPK